MDSERLSDDNYMSDWMVGWYARPEYLNVTDISMSQDIAVRHLHLLAREMQTLRAAIDAYLADVDDLHQSVGMGFDYDWCCCGQPHPCAERQALDALKAARQ